jgi:hypothetical protein
VIILNKLNDMYDEKMYDEKRYELDDIFKKMCIGDKCEKSRRTVKCINDKCEEIKVPTNSVDKGNQIKENSQKKQRGRGKLESPKPLDKELYNYVKKLANKKFKSPSGIYRSSWIVSEYKRRGGKYTGKKSSDIGLKRWYKEKWVDLNRPIRNSKGKIVGYKSCGRKSIKSKDKYPLCRPSKKVNKHTPRTYQSISKSSIKKAKSEKSRIKYKGNIKFGSGKKECGKSCPVCETHLDSKITQMGGCGDMCTVGGGKTRSQFKGTRSDVMIKVPSRVKDIAIYSFKLKKMGFGGGIETGWKRAKQLATKDSIPIEDLKYMRAWFARHIYASYPSYKKWIDAGRPKDSKWHSKHGIISWLIWGGDPAFKWVNSTRNINILNYKPLKLKVPTR